MLIEGVIKMSYDIALCDPVTMERININEPHFIRGGTYVVGGTTELWLNITYNYSGYYYEAIEGGIRSIYGKTGLETINIIADMITSIENKYKDENGEWIVSKRSKNIFFDKDGNEIDSAQALLLAFHDEEVLSKSVEYSVREGDTTDYWEATAANAIRPLHQLMAFAKMRPDGVWQGD